MPDSNGNGTWSWIPRKALIAVITSVLGLLSLIGGQWISSTNTSCKENKIEVVVLKEQKKNTDEKLASIEKQLNRIEDKLDRMGDNR